MLDFLIVLSVLLLGIGTVICVLSLFCRGTIDIVDPKQKEQDYQIWRDNLKNVTKNIEQKANAKLYRNVTDY